MLPIQWKKVTSLTESRESLQRRRHANPNLTKRIAWVLFIEMRESPSLAAPKLYNLCSVEIVFHSNHHVFLIYVLSKKRRKQGTMKKPENNVTKNFFCLYDIKEIRFTIPPSQYASTFIPPEHISSFLIHTNYQLFTHAWPPKVVKSKSWYQSFPP